MAGIIFTRSIFRDITVKLFHKTPNADIWRDVMDLSGGTALKIYPKAKDYYVLGTFSNIEENSDDPWLVVCAFSKIDIETQEDYKQEPDFYYVNEANYMIRLSDVDHLEIFTGESFISNDDAGE